MRRVDQLLTIARDRAGLSSYGANSGVSHALALQAINDAQDHLQAVITSIDSGQFVEHYEFDVVGETETYDLPGNMFINNKIIAVEYSTSGREEDYGPLVQKTFGERNTSRSSHPSYYIRTGNTIYLNPVPTSGSGTVRVTYYKEINDLNTRRGTIDAVTVAGGIITLNTISVDIATLSTANKDSTELAAADYICIVDALGVTKVANIRVTGWNSSTGTFTHAAHTIDTAAGESTPAVGDYVVTGRYMTTHSELPQNCERYLVTYTQKRLLQKNSSTDSLEEDAELMKIENDIITSMAKPTEDAILIPILDDEIIY